MRLIFHSSPSPSGESRARIGLLLNFALILPCTLCAPFPNGPAPLSVPASLDWIGYDGSWSPSAIRVGTPKQWFNVFPSTGSSETWLIGRDGCDQTLECRTRRGGLFLSNESSTWNELGHYEVGHTLQLSYGTYGYYGLDRICLGDQSILTGQVISVINTTDWWIGSLGLGTRKTTFKTEERLSLLGTLAENQTFVPSRSYGYTAGAFYQARGVQSSLTFGGVDRNRFIANDISFALSPEDLPVVSITSIKFSTNTGQQHSKDIYVDEPPRQADRYTIDSSTPFFWFPEHICDSFAKTLGLVYNKTLELYTYGANSTRSSSSMAGSMSITFTLSDVPATKQTVDITIPFSAFDHQLQFPFPGFAGNASSEGLPYFPLRRTTDPKRFTIGRAFLQEAYLTVNFDRRTFSISQAKFPPDGGITKDIVPIDSLPATAIDFTSPVGSVSTAAGVGIGVGGGVLGIVIASVCFAVCLRRRKRKLNSISEQSEHNETKKTQKVQRWKIWHLFKRTSTTPSDSQAMAEAPDDAGVPRYELPASKPLQLAPVELEASEVIRKTQAAENSLPSYRQRKSSADTGAEVIVHEISPSVRGPPVYVLSDVRLDRDDNESQSVSPLGQSFTATGNFSLETPSPLTPLADHSLFDGFSFPPPPGSISPPDDTQRSRSEAQSAETNTSSSENSNRTGVSIQSYLETPQPSRRKFSWEE